LVVDQLHLGSGPQESGYTANSFTRYTIVYLGMQILWTRINLLILPWVHSIFIQTTEKVQAHKKSIF